MGGACSAKGVEESRIQGFGVGKPEGKRPLGRPRRRWEDNIKMDLQEVGCGVGKPEGKRPLGRPRRRWEDNINMDLQEVGCGGMGWIELAQDRERWGALVSAVMNLRVS